MNVILKASDIMKAAPPGELAEGLRAVDAQTPLTDLLRLLPDAPGRRLAVTEGMECVGYIDAEAMLDGVGRLIAPRPDCSLICVDCPDGDYSASMLARAVEDADARLVDLWTSPGEQGAIRVTLRVRHEDPSACVRQLERYGFTVTDARAAGLYTDARTAMDRLAELQVLLNV